MKPWSPSAVIPSLMTGPSGPPRGASNRPSTVSQAVTCPSASATRTVRRSSWITPSVSAGPNTGREPSGGLSRRVDEPAGLRFVDREAAVPIQEADPLPVAGETQAERRSLDRDGLVVRRQLDVPDLDGAVLAGRGDRPAIRRGRQAPDAVGVAVKDRFQRACGHVPASDRLVVAARDERPVVRRERYGEDTLGMPAQRATDATARDLQERGRSAAPRGRRPSGGRRGRRRHPGSSRSWAVGQAPRWSTARTGSPRSSSRRGPCRR